MKDVYRKIELQLDAYLLMANPKELSKQAILSKELMQYSLNKYMENIKELKILYIDAKNNDKNIICDKIKQCIELESKQIEYIILKNNETK